MTSRPKPRASWWKVRGRRPGPPTAGRNRRPEDRAFRCASAGPLQEHRSPRAPRFRNPEGLFAERLHSVVQGATAAPKRRSTEQRPWCALVVYLPRHSPALYWPIWELQALAFASQRVWVKWWSTKVRAVT